MKKKCRYCGAIILKGEYCCDTYARKAKQGSKVLQLYAHVKKDFSHIKRLNEIAKARGHPCIFTGETIE